MQQNTVGNAFLFVLGLLGFDVLVSATCCRFALRYGRVLLFSGTFLTFDSVAWPFHLGLVLSACYWHPMTMGVGKILS